MQSQQKRVKWSRGETAEALEERTDTGITQASVELMENCIPDIYGNISRRPALKPIPYANTYVPALLDFGTKFGFKSSGLVKVVPFYITENDYILIGVYATGYFISFVRIKNDKCVSIVSKEELGKHVPHKVLSYAQQNNYLLIADENNIFKFQFSDVNGYDFVPNIETWSFSGGWYAPNGTQTKIVDGQSMLYGNFRVIGSSFSPYFVQEISNVSTSYSAFNIYLGAHNQEALDDFFSVIPKGSIIYLQNIGCHFRVEGGFLNYKPFPDIVFDGVLNEGDTVPATGKYCRIRDDASNVLDYFLDGTLTATAVIQFKDDIRIIVANTASGTGFSMTHWRASATSKFTTWLNSVETASLSTWIYGSLLTPVVDDTARDYQANVEYGYISMTPNESGAGRLPAFPHPNQLCFCEQRLWAGDWAVSSTESYSVVYGSQIARYNDFKNDYNQENEPIELDILTQYKEKVVHLLDYNGLKIFTDSFEYAYSGGGAVKQSGNGSLAECDPIVFEALCLYCDKTGNQIRAMQYEFQNNIFGSSCINQVAPHDLINFPKTLAGWEDKFNSTGKYLFVVNTNITESPILSVCNFVPSNQANIWSRWKFPTVSVDGETKPLLWDVINLKGNPIFLINMNVRKPDGSQTTHDVVVPAMLNFSDNGDCIGEIQTVGTTRAYAVALSTIDTTPYARLTLFNTEVAIYSDGVFQFTTTTDSTGAITEDLSGLTNITVGLPINSKIVSHPIDVGGKTKSVKKRIGKVQMSVHDTDTGAISINGKTGYMNPQKDHICFYGVSGMKDEVKYTITNKNGAMFHLESLLMNIEYGTLDS